MLQQEGWYPNMPYVQAFSGEYGIYPESPAILDNYTDELMIKLAATNPNGNYLKAAMVDGCARYWCGFVSVIRPALLFLDYGEMRMLNILLQLLLLGVLVYTAPVAFAMGASQTTSNIFSSWCKMLGGQVFLLLMNAWCLRIFTSMVGTFLSNPLSL